MNNSLRPTPLFLICTLLTAHFMDINFNGTIITLFGSLPLQVLGSRGGAGSGPSHLDVYCSQESAALAMGTCHSSEGEEKGVMEKWGKGKDLPPTTGTTPRLSL